MHFSVGLCAHDKNVIKNKINSKSIFKKKKKWNICFKVARRQNTKKTSINQKKNSSNKVYKVL